MPRYHGVTHLLTMVTTWKFGVYHLLHTCRVYIEVQIHFTAQYRLLPHFLRCSTNRKVAGSIPANVSGFFVDTKKNPSDHTKALSRLSL